MPKTIVSPVKRWSGSVVLQDPLLFPAYMKLKAALDDSEVATDPAMKMQIALPGLCACVEKWELKDLGQIAPETFPASPLKASAELFAWLMGEVMALLLEAEEVPNA
jgi:hypothetical protein